MGPGRSPNKVTWDGQKPPSSIHQVWDYTSLRMRELRQKLSDISDAFYGKQDRICAVTSTNDALRVATDANDKTTNNVVATFQDLEGVLNLHQDGQTHNDSSKLAQALSSLRDFQTKAKDAATKLGQSKTMYENEILAHLERFCSGYVKLGIADDDFYKSLQAQTVAIRDVLCNFDKIHRSLQRGGQVISKEHYCDGDISEHILISFDCQRFPILRAVSDLLQKLEIACNVSRDWLRSDRVYVEQLGREVGNTRERMKTVDQRLSLVNEEYDRRFSLLKQRQLELGTHDETADSVWTKLSKLEAKKARLDMDQLAVEKSLNQCRDQLGNLSSSASKSAPSDDAIDSVDGAAPDSEADDDIESVGRRAHSSHRARLRRDARALSETLEHLRHNRRHLGRCIRQKQEMLDDMEDGEAKIQRLSKKLRAAGKKKSKYSHEIQSMRGVLDSLEKALQQRLHPIAEPKSGCPETSAMGDKSARREIASLKKAFRLVKNNIGHGWKDLARSLPYEPAKDLHEINSEIRAIEYENQGQLKEQAYQSLLRWYSHNGRRASVCRLHGALRELNENRLADNLDILMDGRSQSR